MQEPIKIIIADSSRLVRIGLKTILLNYPDLKVVAEAESALELKSNLALIRCDVLLIDYTSDGFSIDIVPQVAQQHPSLKIVAITPEQSGATLVAAVRGGVSSYIKKDCSIEEIIEALTTTAKGSKFFCGQILDTINKESINIEQIEFEPHSCEPISLSIRELEIIKLIADGYTNTQVADQLYLSAHTVNTHRKNIMKKLGVNNTAAIVMYAVKTNLVSPNKFLFSAQ
ncbi:MAG: LuxR C-terminal-related transcriptional regulator [Luteibaculaceae bacterium]